MSNYNATLELPYESTSDNFLDVGIHENVEMIRVEYNKTEKNEFIAFYFQGPTGEKLSHTEWKPTGDDAAKVADKELNQMSRIKQIVLNFMPKEQFVFQANSFEEFAKKVIELLGTKFVGVKLRLKVVYSGKYTSLPNYWKFRFIERMDEVPAEKSKIKVLSIDKMVRPSADPLPTNTNPFEATASANLPF